MFGKFPLTLWADFEPRPLVFFRGALIDPRSGPACHGQDNAGGPESGNWNRYGAFVVFLQRVRRKSFMGS